jgi:hypothetical protein
MRVGLFESLLVRRAGAGVGRNLRADSDQGRSGAEARQQVSTP